MSMETNDRLRGALGLCIRAGQLICGVPMICEALKRKGPGRPVLVLEACDNSDNTHKRITDRCRFYGIPCRPLSLDGVSIGVVVGKTTHLAAVAVTDRGLAELVEKTIINNTPQETI